MNTPEEHPELDQIMENAQKELLSEVKQQMIQDFTAFERQLFESQGDPDCNSEIWALQIVAKSKEEIQERIAEGLVTDESLIGEELNPDHEGMMALTKIGSGSDIYEGLDNYMMSCQVSEIESVCGVLIRCGAWQAPLSDEPSTIRPSEHPEKRSSIITLMVTNSMLVSCVRDSITNETIINSMLLTDYEFDESKLSDALVRFWLAPQKIKEDHPKVWEGILDAIADSLDEEGDEA